ncbi:MAG: polysaccharide biosynthesis protein [Candidatus Krumholzibacteriota bacterium]|nr:polysaccharide biosynthesis protein [Candidatus Krumholzibacteriota bacterium]
MGTTTRRIGTAAAWSVMARAGRFALGMASSVLVVRSLGEHDYGVLSLLRTILMFVMMACGAGMGKAVLKFLPALRVDGTMNEARRLIRRVFLVSIFAWALLAFASYVFSNWIAGLFDYEGMGTLVVLAVSLGVFELTFTLLSQLFYSNYDTKLQSIASVAMHVVYLGVLAIVLPLGWGILGVVIATAAGYLFAVVTILPRVPTTMRFDGGSGSETVSHGRLFRYALPLTAIGLLNIVVWRQSETLFLAYFRSAAETGYFDLAYRMPQTILEFIPGTVWPLVMAGVSEVYARDRKNLRAAIDRYYRILFLICAPICLTGIVLGGRMIVVLFGDAMSPASVPTQMFFAIFTLSFFATPLSMALYVMEKTHVNLAIYCALAIVNVGLDVLLIPRFGVVGAIVPVAFVIAVSPFLYALAVRREIKTISIPFRFISKCFIASSPVLLLIPLTRYVTGVIELVAAAIVALLVLIVSFRIVRVVGPAEHELLESIPVPMAARLLRFMSS